MIHAGIDLVDSRRIAKMLKEHKEAFLERICTEKEREYLKTQKRLDEKVAGMFALKEAFAKAVGTGLGEMLRFREMEISYTDLGQPRLAYLGNRFFKSGKPWNVSCSLSHEGHMLAAVVIIEGEL